jgi:predicted nuclease with RNAse H fold
VEAAQDGPLECRSVEEIVIGVDFAGPARASHQRRKLLAVAARRLGRARYAISTGGLNAQLLRWPPGWTAGELADAILQASGRVSVVAADFPFSIPAALLERDSFARRAHRPRALRSWGAFNRAVASALPLDRPVDYGPFSGWRDPRFWVRRATDVACGAQPPLKDKFQVLFNMTLLGNAFLARLEASGRFDVVPFQSRGRAAVIEIYPGHLMRSAGLPSYKRAPREAIDAAIRLLRERGLSLEVAPELRAVCETYDTGRGDTEDHDAADALVAACGAILYREGRARELCGAAPEVRMLEGAIWSV